MALSKDILPTGRYKQMQALEQQGANERTWAVHSDDNRFDAGVNMSRQQLSAHHCAGNLLHPGNSRF